jgi:hypothetical protein
MATGQTCCHLLGELLNSSAKAANRAQISRLQKKQKPFKFPFTFLAWPHDIDSASYFYIDLYIILINIQNTKHLSLYISKSAMVLLLAE